MNRLIGFQRQSDEFLQKVRERKQKNGKENRGDREINGKRVQ